MRQYLDMTNLLALPRSAWRRVLLLTALIVGGATLVSLLTSLGISLLLTGRVGIAGIAAATLIPILVGTPMTFIYLVRVSQLRLANDKLHVLASTDWLTSCLNRRVFTTQVSERLKGRGCLLVIDADHFKIINDRYGHDRGDEVLKLMADAIRQSVRGDDLVGRIGGEEFGVFLSGASFEIAELIAERIRLAVAALYYAPEGEPVPLSISVGGAFFSGPVVFTDLFRIADQRLYHVKQDGRNRVEIAHAGDHPSIRLVPKPAARTALAG